jgi:ribosome-associated heat shock protein Hsp15
VRTDNLQLVSTDDRRLVRTDNRSPRTHRQKITSMESLRLDVWLDVTCLFRTRSEAKRACEGGKVEVNGEAAKPHRNIRPGDQIRITRPFGRRQTVIVRTLADHHVKKSDARRLYEDVTPVPTAEEMEARRMDRVYRAAAAAAGTDRRRRQEIRRMKERYRP